MSDLFTPSDPSDDATPEQVADRMERFARERLAHLDAKTRNDRSRTIAKNRKSRKVSA